MRRTRDALSGFPDSPVAVLAIGKAAAGMAQGARAALDGRIVTAFAVTPASAHRELPRHWQRRVGDHPVPGQASLAAGRAVRDWLQELSAELPLLVLLSGGGSALVELPVDGMQATELVRLNRWLLGSGLDIHRINDIRARFSQLKRGGLLKFTGDRKVCGLVISDVPGDRIEDIASGPLSPVREPWSADGLPAWLNELHERVPLPATVERTTADVRVIARNADALDSVARSVIAEGLQVVSRESLHGDAERGAERICERMRQGPPGVYLCGGETVVNLPETHGRGGRNQQLALAAARKLERGSQALLLALGTDGVDGNSEDAGALVDNESAMRIRDAGIDIDTSLATFDSGNALAASGDVIHTGPTGTNVADIVIGWKP